MEEEDPDPTTAAVKRSQAEAAHEGCTDNSRRLSKALPAF